MVVYFFVGCIVVIHYTYCHVVTDKAMIKLTNDTKYGVIMEEKEAGTIQTKHKCNADIPKTSLFGIHKTSHLKSYTAVLQASKLLILITSY